MTRSQLFKINRYPLPTETMLITGNFILKKSDNKPYQLDKNIRDDQVVYKMTRSSSSVKINVVAIMN
jgi:hypothetical protein